MASVIATGRWHITVWYFSPFTLEKKEAFHLEVAGSREQKCNAGEKVTDLHEGDSRYLTFRSSHMQQTPREPVCRFVFWRGVVGGGLGMSSLHSVTYRGNVSSKRACVWDLEILLWSGMLVVKTTGCKGIWPSLGYRGIIGWFHTKVNCSNVKSGKTGTFRNKTLGRGEIIFLFLFVVGATWFFSRKFKECDCHLFALAFIRFGLTRPALLRLLIVVCISGNVLRAQDVSSMNNWERREESTMGSPNSRVTLCIQSSYANSTLCPQQEITHLEITN